MRKAEAENIAQEQGTDALTIPGLGLDDEMRKRLESADTIPGLAWRPGQYATMRDNYERRQAYKQPIKRAHREFEQTWHAPGAKHWRWNNVRY